jgi:hypothetical protein
MGQAKQSVYAIVTGGAPTPEMNVTVIEGGLPTPQVLNRDSICRQCSHIAAVLHNSFSFPPEDVHADSLRQIPHYSSPCTHIAIRSSSFNVGAEKHDISGGNDDGCSELPSPE